MKKMLIGMGIVLGMFILFIWWGSTIETPHKESATVAEVLNENFTSEKGNFSIHFEGMPQYTPGTLTMTTGETYPTHLYQYKAVDESIWQVFYTEYPESTDISNPENVLLNTVRGTESSVAGKIISTETGTYQGFPSVDYVINIPEQQYVFKGRNIINGRKLYSVGYIYDEGKELPSKSFFDSLKIVK